MAEAASAFFSLFRHNHVRERGTSAELEACAAQHQLVTDQLLAALKELADGPSLSRVQAYQVEAAKAALETASAMAARVFDSHSRTGHAHVVQIWRTTEVQRETADMTAAWRAAIQEAERRLVVVLAILDEVSRNPASSAAGMPPVKQWLSLKVDELVPGRGLRLEAYNNDDRHVVTVLLVRALANATHLYLEGANPRFAAVKADNIKLAPWQPDVFEVEARGWIHEPELSFMVTLKCAPPGSAYLYDLSLHLNAQHARSTEHFLVKAVNRVDCAAFLIAKGEVDRPPTGPHALSTV